MSAVDRQHQVLLHLFADLALLAITSLAFVASYFLPKNENISNSFFCLFLRNKLVTKD